MIMFRVSIYADFVIWSLAIIYALNFRRKLMLGKEENVDEIKYEDDLNVSSRVLHETKLAKRLKAPNFSKIYKRKRTFVNNFTSHIRGPALSPNSAKVALAEIKKRFCENRLRKTGKIDPGVNTLRLKSYFFCYFLKIKI